MGKNTLPVRFGLRFGRWEVTALLLVPYLLNGYWLFLAPGGSGSGTGSGFGSGMGSAGGALAAVGGGGGNSRGGVGWWSEVGVGLGGGGGAGGGGGGGGCWHAALLTSLTAPLAAHVTRRTWRGRSVDRSVVRSVGAKLNSFDPTRGGLVAKGRLGFFQLAL